MADSLNTPTLPKLHPGLSRRALMREMAAAGALVAVSIPAVAEPERKFETSGTVPADDLLPRHREVREVVLEFERYGHQVVFSGAGIAVSFGESQHEPLSLWDRYYALDRPLLVEWLRLSGRVEPKTGTAGPAVQS